MMKQFKILLSLLAICFAACGSDDPSPSPTPPDPPSPTGQSERSVLIYMAANSDLARKGLFDADFEEMKKGSKTINANQNLIVYVNKSGTATEKPYLARLKDGQVVDSTTVEGSVSSDPAALEKALSHMCEKYPAKSYGLVLWGHANSWLIRSDSIVYAKTRAYGYDESTSPDTYMNFPSMARAIKNGMNGSKLSYIFGDCCEIGCVEVAYELRNVADYLIASPAEIPGEGAYYEDLTDLFDTSSNFYQKIIDKYWDFYFNAFVGSSRYYIYNPGDLAGYSVPLVAIKTSELENLATATASLLSTISDKLQPTGTLDLSQVIYFSINNGMKLNYDMYKTLKMNTAAADFNAWVPAFEKAVPYYRMSARWYSIYTSFYKPMTEVFDGISSDHRVLSMFFPGKQYNNVYPSWNKTIQQLQWNGPISWQQYGW